MKSSLLLRTLAITCFALTSMALTTTAHADVPDLKANFAKADPDAGKKSALICGTCHSFNKGEAAKIGPNLYGIVGSPHAHMQGYNYSPAMKTMHDHTWDFNELNQFLYAPSAHLPGTKMTYSGVKDDQTRANIIAWLNTLSDNPLPLPK